MHKQTIVWIEDVGKNDVGLVGGKGANLGEMTTAGFPIPYGFIVTSHAYFNFIAKANIQPKIKDTLALLNVDNPNELRQASQHIQKLIMESKMPLNLAHQIISHYEKLNEKEQLYFKKRMNMFDQAMHTIKNVYNSPLVAVRSSATAEDLSDASFAGQQETYLNIKGDSALLKKIHECWASLFTERAIYYRHNQGFDHFKVGLAAVVQRMVESDKSGVAFSIDPVTNDKSKLVIEAIYGLGEYIVQGKVTPDHYEVDKKSYFIIKKEKKYQNIKLVKAGVENKEVKLGKEEGNQQKLTTEEIVKLSFLVNDIEKHYYFPQDIEWAIEKDKIFIVQSRPITTIKSDKDQKKSNEASTAFTQLTPLVIGSPASPGIGVGPVKVIHSPREIDKIKKGDVLVAPQTNPDYVPAMKKAVAIVTEKGGRTSHAAIVSRELGIPAVVGAEGATTKLKNDMTVSVNGISGEVFKGSILSGAIKNETEKNTHNHLRTLTHVYVNLAEPEQANKIAKMNVDGVGLLRAEFMIAGIGTHPKEFIKEHKEQIFITKLTNELVIFAKAFNPRPVIYRATDFKTNEYRHLKGGAQYEPKEENPMIGFRGASRYIANPDVFALELQAVRNIWDMGYRNLHLMIPFVRVPWELVKIKDLVTKSGLFSHHGFKLLIMVEVPSCALNLEEFLKVGVDGVSIGTNDLTMMLMGVDRDNQEVANIYDERNPVIIDVLEYIVKTCTRYGITSSICGQAASDYPEIVRKLVSAGITSVSVNPDTIDRTREQIFAIEKEHIKRNK